jgi:hypothetical protein
MSELAGAVVDICSHAILCWTSGHSINVSYTSEHEAASAAIVTPAVPGGTATSTVNMLRHSLRNIRMPRFAQHYLACFVSSFTRCQHIDPFPSHHRPPAFRDIFLESRAGIWDQADCDSLRRVQVFCIKENVCGKSAPRCMCRRGGVQSEQTLKTWSGG